MSRWTIREGWGRAAVLLVAVLSGAGAASAAVNVGYYDMTLGSGNASQVAPITAAGQTPVQLLDLQAADLAGIKVLFVQNQSNGAYGAEYLSRLSAIQTAVANGMILVIHDRFVSNGDGTGGAKTILPGGAGFSILRNFSDPNNIEVRDASTPVTNGAGGVITNTSLDGGSFSDHGYADPSTLPTGARLILSRTDPNQIVTFLYPFGNGAVLYSTIPLDLFLAGSGPNPPRAAFTGIYAVNVVDYAARLAQGVPDLGVTLTDGVATAVPGTSVTYTLQVKNFGIGQANGSVVMDDFPPELTGVTWTCAATGGGSCTASGTGDVMDTINLPVGGVLTYTATGVIAPSATGTLQNVALVVPAQGTDPIPGNDSAADVDTLTPVSDLAVVKAGPASAGSGPTLTYTLTVKNAGPSDAQGVSLSDPTPPGLTFASAGSPCAGGFPCNLGTIAAGGQKVVTATFNLPSPYLGPDPIVNLAAASTTSRDPVPGNNSARATTPVGTPSANLAVAVSGPPSAALSSTVTFTVTVTNNGPHDAQAVSLSHTPPSGLLFVGATAPCAGGFPCSLGTLNAGASTTVKVTFGIPAGYSGANPIPYSAAVTSTTADPTPGNNSASAAVPLGADTADLTLTKTGPTAASLGTDVIYTLVVTNRGPAAATGVQLRDTTPAGLTFVTADPPCAAGFPCNLGTLAAGQSATVKATFNIPAGYSGANPFANVASVVADTPEGSPGDNTATALTGIGADAADLTLVKMGPGQVAAGSRLSYVLLVTNKGPATAHGVSLAESTPANLIFQGATAPCASGFPCALGNLPAGHTEAIGVSFDVRSNHVSPNPLVNNASVTSGDADPNPGDNAASTSTTVVYRADLAVTKTDGVAQTSPGLGLTYTIVVTNNGPSDVAGATVADSVPAALTGVTWTCAAGSGASCTASGSGSISDTVNLAAGASITYTLSATVAAGASGSLTNTATATVPGGVQDPVAGNNSATDTDTVVQPADLTVTKAGPASATAGTNLAYTVTVRNQGTGAATSVVLTDPTPPGLTFVSASAPCAAGFPCSLPDLPAGQSTQVTVTYGVPAGYTTPNPILNTASATTASPETSTNNNSATASTPVAFLANLGVTKTDGRNTVVPGDALTYTIVVTNAGPSNAVGASVVDTPPALLQNVQWTCAAAGGASCGTASGSGAINTTPSLPVGGSVTYTLTATVDPAAQTAVVNQATVAPPAGETDPVPGNNTATDSDGVTPKADLAIAKTDGATAAVPGRPLTYTIAVSNLGPSNVTGATVQDSLPAVLQSPAWTCAATGGAACGSPSGTGSLSTTADLPSGGAVTYTVTATVSPAATGTLSNTATVTAPATIFDPDLGNNSATDSEPLTRVADLTLTKLGPGRVERGAALTYTLTVANAGPSDAAVTLTDPTPAGLTFSSAAAPCAGGFPCNLGTIAAGASVTFTATWTVPADYAGPDPIVNVAAVRSDASDPRPADDTARSATAVARAPQADLSIAKTAPAVASVGSTVTYRLTVTNNGPDDAQGVILSESIPAGLSFVSATAPCQTGFDCPLGTLNAGASRSVDVTLSIPAGYAGPSLIVNNASVAATTADPATGNNAASAITSLVASAIDLEVVKLAPVQVDRGQDLVYTLKVTNHGPATATNVFLADPTPAGLTFASATAPCAGGFPCFLDTLAPGQTKTVQVAFHVPAGYSGADPIVNTASASANEPDGVPGNDSATAFTGVGHPAADLEVMKTAPAQVAAGSLVTATIVVRNLGPGTAPAAVLSDPTPAGTTFVSASAPCAGGFPCNLGDLAAGSAVTVTATFRAASGLAAGTVVTNTASVAGGAADPQAGNNSSQASTTVFLQADFAIAKTDGVTQIAPGRPVTYTITVTSNGPSDATGVRVTDTFPAALTGVSWTCAASAGSSCAGGASGAGNIDRMVNLLAGGTVTYTATATISPAATGTLANTAAVQAPAAVPDPVPGNNSATDTDTLTPQADLAITKTDGQTTAVPGRPVTYTITVTNNGPSNAPGVTVADSFPAALAGITWTCTASAGSSCTSGGPGQILDVINLASGGTATYTATGVLDPGASQPLVNTATVTAPAGVTELNPANNTATDTDTLTFQADLAVTKTDGQTTATPGGQVTWVITVTNNGPSNVAGATVTDTPPAVVTAPSWTCTASTGAHCTASGNGGIADTVDLPANGSVTYTLTATINPAATGTLTNQATVAVPAGVTDPVPGNNTASDSDTLSRRADLAVTKTDGRTAVSPGVAVTYTLVVTNLGPSNVTGASVIDAPPASLTGVTWTCIPSTGAACTSSGNGNIVDTVSLPPGGTLTYQLTATVAQGTTSPVVNSASVGVPAGTTDPVPGNNNASDTDTIAPISDLGVTLTADLTLAQPNNNLVYTLKVTNNGPANATGARVADTFPAAFTTPVWTCSATAGSACPAGTGGGDLNALVNVAVGGTVTFTITGRIAATPPPSITNSATVTPPAGTTDPNGANDTASLITQVGTLIFKDGFESGGLTMWSGQVP